MADTQVIAKILEEDVPESGKLDFFGEAVCALKPAFREGYNAAAAEFRREKGRSLRSYLPAICGCDGIRGAENIPAVNEVEKPEALPGVIMSIKIGDYFFNRFLSKFTGKRYFERLELPVHPVFERAGLRDPNGEFHMFSVMPTVMLVDKKMLGGRPMPRRWSDLLDPAFAGDVALPAAHGAVSTLLPLTVLRDHGEAGLETLHRAVRCAMPSTDMIRGAGATLKGPAVYVVAWFFAKACPSPDAEIVWPEDGALVEPSFLLVQNGRREEYRTLVEFITGAGFGEVSAAHAYPAANPAVDNKLPAGAVFNWLGWEFIRSVPLEDRIAAVRSYFANLIV